MPDFQPHHPQNSAGTGRLSLSTTDVHDLRGAATTLSLGLEAIRAGYRFDDDMRELKLQALEAAVQKVWRIADQLRT